MENSLVSVIIPTYNRAHLLAEAIQSVLVQDYPAKQIIVIDDGSTDDTRRVVSAFAGVEYYYQPNRGQAAARNAGLRRSRGTYIASLDSDDIWTPTFLSAGIERLQQHGLNLVFMNWQASNGLNGLEGFCRLATTRQRYFTQATGDWWLLQAPQTRRLMLETCPAPSSAFIVRRSAMPGGWNEQLRIADDWGLLLDVVLHQPTAAAFTLVPHWLKRIHGQNIYDGRDYRAVAQELSFHDEPLLLQRYRPRLCRAEVSILRQRQAEHLLTYAYHCYKQQERANCAQYLARAVWRAPVATTRRVLREVLTYVQRQRRAL